MSHCGKDSLRPLLAHLSKEAGKKCRQAAPQEDPSIRQKSWKPLKQKEGKQMEVPSHSEFSRVIQMIRAPRRCLSSRWLTIPEES